MQLAFEQVSFTYDAPFAGKRKQRTQQNQAASWGNDPSGNWALKDITFTVNEGDFLGIAGHTGSGKSTLVQHMNGLLTPSRGFVRFDGKDLSAKANRAACRKEVGVVLQYPERQLFAPTVFDDVAFGPRNLGWDEDTVNQHVRRALASVELDADEIGALSPFELSGGQQRRVAFAGVLAMNPHILVLDEPTAGLDPQAHARFLSLIQELHRQGLTIVMVSHNMEDLARSCTRMLVLNQGSIALEGTPEQVFSEEELLKSIGLNVPAAQQTALRLRARGINLPARLYTDEEDLARACAQLYRQNKAAGQ